MIKMTEKRLEKMLIETLFFEGGTIDITDLKDYIRDFHAVKLLKNPANKISDYINTNKELVWYKKTGRYYKTFCINKEFLKKKDENLFKVYDKFEKNIMKKYFNITNFEKKDIFEVLKKYCKVVHCGKMND